jgi:general secretion pathway protein K
MMRQRGAALITAMLTVALVASLAVAAQWQQWQQTEVEQAQRTRQQAAWILVGALDWSRLILREDARSNSTDHLSEPWALPLKESRLGTFLRMDDAQGDDEGSNLSQALLSGRIVDAQSRLNWANLVIGQRLSEPDLSQFARLFQLLGLPRNELDQASEAYRELLANQQQGRADPQLSWPPTRWEDLGRLGLSQVTLDKLQAHATLLPERTKVNLNTAQTEVLQAALEGLDGSQAERLIQLRSRSHFQSLEQVRERMPDLRHRVDDARHGVASNHFEILGQLQIDRMVVRETTLVRRDGLEVRVVWRRSTTPQP